MNFMKCVFSIAILMGLLGCVSSSFSDERLKLYDDVLSQLIDDRYCHYCSEPGNFIKGKYEEFIEGRIDSVAYFNTLDSLKLLQNDSKKCLLEYSEGLNIFYIEEDKVDPSIRSSIQRNLQDPFIVNHFKSIQAAAIVDTLALKAAITANDLSAGCMEIIPYVRNPENPFKNGTGVLGFSKIYFNHELNSAVVYYEFMCGRSCGRGEILFLEKVNSRWRINKYTRIWDS